MERALRKCFYIRFLWEYHMLLLSSNSAHHRPLINYLCSCIWGTLIFVWKVQKGFVLLAIHQIARANHILYIKLSRVCCAPVFLCFGCWRLPWTILSDWNSLTLYNHQQTHYTLTLKFLQYIFSKGVSCKSLISLYVSVGSKQWKYFCGLWEPKTQCKGASACHDKMWGSGVGGVARGWQIFRCVVYTRASSI